MMVGSSLLARPVIVLVRVTMVLQAWRGPPRSERCGTRIAGYTQAACDRHWREQRRLQWLQVSGSSQRT